MRVWSVGGVLGACWLTLAGCGEHVVTVIVPLDAGLADAGAPDAGTPDAGTADAGAPDAGTADAGTPDAGVQPPAPSTVPLFVLQGQAGRTAVSCDLGRTWRADRSDAPAVRCFADTGGTDCDHHPGNGQGLAYGNGWFVGTFGWGSPPGVIRRSRDGVAWETVAPDANFGGLVFGRGTFLAGGWTPLVSRDDGATWERGGESGMDVWTVRRAGFGGAGGVFLLHASSGPSRAWARSTDEGRTWAAPEVMPAECSAGDPWTGGIVSGGSVLVTLEGGTACRSVDDGRTWRSASVGGQVESQLLWTGSEFVAWGRRDGTDERSLFRSADGASWTAVPTRTRTLAADGSAVLSAGPALGATAFGEGVYVGVNGGWQQYYERQAFFRSTDGVTWDALPASAFTGGHPVKNIAFGRGPPSSAACP
jgi:hypothetical protein